jgi:protein ImuB
MHWIALQPPPETAPATRADDALHAPLVDSHTALAWWALRFTPLVARVEDALVLEVSGSERLFGGRAALLAQLFQPNQPLAPVCYAQGATSLIALGRLGCGPATLLPDDLPLHTLAAARPHLPTLTRLGCNTWGQLRALPRGGLVRRFGAPLVDALDRAYGQQPEVYPWLTVPEVFDMPLELTAQVETAAALLFGARRLLAQLQAWLQARQRGVLALELCWELDARRANARHVDAHHAGDSFGRLVLRTAQATQDMQHLQRLLGEQLARVTLPAPVLHLRLRSLETQALSGESLSLLPDALRPGDSLHQMLERLCARLGPEQVLCARAQADHRPEHMQRWVPWSPSVEKTFAMKSGAACAVAAGAGGLKHFRNTEESALYPTWLLARPLPLAVQGGCPQYAGPLTLLVGPQRIEAGWLEGDAACTLRDYFVARSAQAGLVWIYRERLAGRSAAGQGGAWYLHGLFA